MVPMFLSLPEVHRNRTTAKLRMLSSVLGSLTRRFLVDKSSLFIESAKFSSRRVAVALRSKKSKSVNPTVRYSAN